MSYSNYGYGFGGQSWRKPNFSRNSQYSGYRSGRSSYGGNQQRKKRSGCKKKSHTRTGEDKGVIINGWRTSRAGLISYVAVPASSKYQTTSLLKMVVKVRQGIQENTFWGTWNNQKGILYVQGINLIGMPGKDSSFFRKGR